MAFIIIPLFFIGIVIAVYVPLYACGFLLNYSSIKQVESPATRLAAWGGVLGFVALISSCLVPIAWNLQFQFEEPGDGGLGMLFNYTARFAAAAACPCITLIVLGGMIRLLSSTDD